MSTSQIENYFSRQAKPRQLQLLVALADLQSVGRVAQALHVTQPAVSKMIADMERGLGIALFERDGRHIRPTAFGTCLTRQARDLVLHAHRAAAELQAMVDGTGGRIELGVLSVAAPVLVPRALAAFKARAPTATVCLREGTLDQLLPELRAGRLDLVVGRLASDLIGADLSAEPLFTDPTAIVAAHDHPLARRARVRWADLDGLPWIVPTGGAPMYQRLLAALDAHGVRKPVNLVESVVLYVNLELLRTGGMLGLLPHSLTRHHAAAGHLKILPLRLGGTMDTVGIIARRSPESAPVVALFKTCLRDAGKGLAS